MFDTNTLAHLNDLRGKVLRGELVSDEQLKEALQLLGEGRAMAVEASKEKRKREKTTSIAVGTGESLLAKMA